MFSSELQFSLQPRTLNHLQYMVLTAYEIRTLDTYQCIVLTFTKNDQHTYAVAIFFTLSYLSIACMGQH